MFLQPTVRVVRDCTFAKNKPRSNLPFPLVFRTDNNGYFALLAPLILTPAENGKVNKWFRMARADHLSTHHGCSAIPPRTCKKSKGFVGTHELHKQGLVPT